MTARNNAIDHRSEKVRQRRSQDSDNHVRRATSAARNPAQQRVFVRNVGMGTPVLQRTQSRTKRKFFISLDSTTELSLPAVPTIRLGWRALSGGMVVMLFAIILFLNSSPTFQVSAPTFTGLKRVGANEAALVADLGHTNIFSIEPQKVADKLSRSFTELTNISVKVSLPAGVAISANERKPLLQWKMGDQVIWIDAEGAMFSARGTPPAPLLTVESSEKPPILKPAAAPVDVLAATQPTPTPTPDPATVDPAKQRVDPDFIKAVLSLAKSMPADTALVYSSKDGLGWNDPNGWKVYFGGTLAQMDLKLSVYARIVDEMNKQGIKPAMISVANPYTPFYRLEK